MCRRPFPRRETRPALPMTCGVQSQFSILGTTYGGDGRVNFGLPDLQGRSPVHVGNGIALGELGGEATHTLNISEIPAHNHVPVGSSNTATVRGAAGNLWSADSTNNPYNPTADTAMNPATLGASGG